MDLVEQVDPTNPVEHHTAIEARLKGAVHVDIAVFDVGEEPDPLPDHFATPHVGRAFGDGNPRGGGYRGTQDWRVVVKCSARTAGACRWVQGEITRALEGHPLAIGGVNGEHTSLLDLESAQYPEQQDDGFHTGSVTFTYTH